ncbi:MAG: OprO/OprP family phosphate-selective porin [Dysgonamonadaceae bacterium]|jgi:hypothetical protein|nr:OprO/OprP family phosphate-selective porin [Dysgonamonadaceae bacterium]
MNKKRSAGTVVVGLFLCLFLPEAVWAQKLSGYVQGQYQWGEPGATLKVGGPNETPSESFHRIGLRRARLKATHEKKIFSGVLEIDLSEKGVSVKDAYLHVKDPWRGVFSLRAGIFTRPFGYELSYPTTLLESPERSILCQTLFPDEKDLGVMVQIQPASTSPWHFLKFAGGWFAGNGVKQETDNRRDFMGRLSADKVFNRWFRMIGGLSYYRGSVYQGTENVYSATGDGFVLNSRPDNRGNFSLREYFGIDAEWSITLPVTGRSQLQAQYVFGTQPGSVSGSRSPNASTLPTHDVYNREFAGGYLLLVQELGRWPFSAVLKYDWYDPHTRIAGNSIGLNHTGSGDVAVRHFGGGLVWRIDENFRLQAYYEINRNETTNRLAEYAGDLRDNVFTLRAQYAF